MRVPLPFRHYTAGPWTLIGATLLAVALGVVLVYTRGDSHASMLYYFYLPVVATAVILGYVTGLVLAVATIIAVTVPSIWVGTHHLVPADVPDGERFAAMAIWAVFLLAMAWLVGWVSERGGSLSLTRGLGSRAIKAIEQVQRRTGQDIHDGIAQYAAAAYIEAGVLEDMTAQADPGLQAQVKRVRRPLDALVTEARAMVGNLRPPLLGPKEFVSTLSDMVKNFESRTGVPCEFEIEGDFASHSDSMRICVYRTFQEALTNIERHSGATQARVWARASRGGVHLAVRDNGKGFDLEEVENGKRGSRYGLSGIQERISYLGGKVSFTSAPGEGTSLTAYIPGYRGEKHGRIRASRLH